MRTSLERKTMDMEARDTNYFFQAYLLNYLFESKNEDPVEVIVPMFPAFPHPRKPGVMIPIKWIAPDEPIAVEIAKDGSNIPEAEIVEEPKEEVVEQPKDSIESLPKALEEGPTVSDALESTTPEEVKSPAKAALDNLKKVPATKPPDRAPKMPDKLAEGSPDGMGSRDVRADKHIARDLKDEPEVAEEKEIPAEIEKPKK